MSKTKPPSIDPQIAEMLRRIKTMPPKPRLEMLQYLRRAYGLRLEDIIRGAEEQIAGAKDVGCSMPVIDDVIESTAVPCGAAAFWRAAWFGSATAKDHCRAGGT
jgi:hypothetical protein